MSFDVFSEYATDSSKEENGTWFDLGKGARVLVARANNRAFSRMLTKQIERNRKVLDGEDDAADTKSDEIMVDVLANTVLLGWEGLSFKGASMSYSVDNAKKLLAIKDFRARVQGFAGDFEAYKFREESAAGNA